MNGLRLMIQGFPIFRRLAFFAVSSDYGLVHIKFTWVPIPTLLYPSHCRSVEDKTSTVGVNSVISPVSTQEFEV